MWLRHKLYDQLPNDMCVYMYTYIPNSYYNFASQSMSFCFSISLHIALIKVN